MSRVLETSLTEADQTLYATLDTVLTYTMVGTKHQKATTLLVGDNREFKGISWMVLLLAR